MSTYYKEERPAPPVSQILTDTAPLRLLHLYEDCERLAGKKIRRVTFGGGAEGFLNPDRFCFVCEQRRAPRVTEAGDG